ncbi:2-dehydro-3-deoxygalactonokinase [Pontibaca salina]|uniref:2-dehydro-3-deoxygalactonokinase n=1 Tax=Pontibaca salina TaxID=2795731 RepID=A0A934M0Y1_9RHOB|nr:2-dehydro-3-deoxygalactonokinase [Pontibaca salina]MBI6630208.1 2-dehydro-3-deoxygalactonokinase [Pontibaca salina]
MQKNDIGVNWIAVEIRAETLKAWAMKDTRALASSTANRTQSGLESELLALIGHWLTANVRIDVVACGPSEAPLHPIPAKPAELSAVAAAIADKRVALSYLPGLSQTAPPAIMQGPETHIAGFLSLNPGWDGVICLPGAQTVWAHVSAGEVVSFQSFLTLGLIQTLSRDLQISGCGAEFGNDDPAFAEAVNETLTRPERLATRLAAIPAQHRLTGQTHKTGYAQLLGFLIGAELAAARPYWLGQQLAVIGDNDAASAYQRALSLQGAPSVLADDTATLLKGMAERRIIL